MILNKIRVYHLFLLVTLLIVIIGIKSYYEDTVLDINIHDTYYVISHFELAIVLSFLYFLQGLGYLIVQKILKRKLVDWLTIVHTFIMIGSFIYYWLFTGYYRFLAVNSNSLFDNSYQTINITLTILTLLIVCIGVPAYLINLLIGIFRKQN